MRHGSWMLIGLLTTGLSVGGCTVKVEDEGRAPDLSEGDPGELPRVDVDPAKVEISTDTQQVITPRITVTPVEDNDSASDSTP
jgi:hypothetical protein